MNAQPDYNNYEFAAAAVEQIALEMSDFAVLGVIANCGLTDAYDINFRLSFNTPRLVSSCIDRLFAAGMIARIAVLTPPEKTHRPIQIDRQAFDNWRAVCTSRCETLIHTNDIISTRGERVLMLHDEREYMLIYAISPVKYQQSRGVTEWGLNDLRPVFVPIRFIEEQTD